MSIPTPGNYYIVNGVPNTYDGSRLAINFNGQGVPLNVSPLVTSNVAQVWTIEKYDSNTQSVSPKSAPGLQIAFGDNYLTALPAGSYVWTIRGQSYNYTFQDGQMSVYWDLDTASSGQNVTYHSEQYPEEQWWLYPA